MKVKFIFLLFVLFIGLFTSCKEKSSNSSLKSTPNYTEPKKTCKPSTSKIRKLVRKNWNSIKRVADFTVSNKGNFEIKNYGLDGDDLVVDILSKGYLYDISFTASFEAYFDDNCSLNGLVTDCYNYIKH